MHTEHLQLVLEETFSANFVAYYRSHVAHVNIVGRNFASDHKLLQKVYEDLQGTIDPIAELLRTIGAKMPNDLATVLAISPFADDPVEGDADELLQLVLDDQEKLLDLYKELDQAANEAGDIDISNFAQGRVGDHAKFRWMLRSTLELE
jgi:starvation-inducible DNA-binding protein